MNLVRLTAAEYRALARAVAFYDCDLEDDEDADALATRKRLDAAWRKVQAQMAPRGR